MSRTAQTSSAPLTLLGDPPKGQARNPARRFGHARTQMEDIPMALPSAEPCPTCTQDLVILKMTVDGHDLMMNSCQNCDTRHWQLAGDEIDLARALEEVGTHSGRRR